MEIASWNTFWILLVFSLGYGAIILEHYIKINKGASALLIAVLCWMIYVSASTLTVSENIKELAHHVGEVSQIIFFLMGAMTLVELVDSHKGFKIITDRINTNSKKKMIWIIGAVSFFLSSVLDNLTTTILMVSLLRKIVPERSERILLGCIIVIAANAGGAWTPIGDVTTTMLWINGQLTSLSVIKALFIPSVVSVLIPLMYFTWKVKGKLPPVPKEHLRAKVEPGARLVLCLGVGGLVFVPIFKGLTGLPPFMGILLALGVVWLVTDLMHYKHNGREHLRVPHILTRVDTSGILFFLGILLCVDALQSAGLLQALATWLDTAVHNQAMIATLIGVFSAIIDNVPLVAATIGMYPLEIYPTDSSLWQMIAYAAGVGGSMLIIGSSSGVALMGLEKMDFVTYAKKATLPVLIGFLAGMGVYLLLSPFVS